MKEDHVSVKGSKMDVPQKELPKGECLRREIPEEELKRINPAVGGSVMEAG